MQRALSLSKRLYSSSRRYIQPFHQSNYTLIFYYTNPIFYYIRVLAEGKPSTATGLTLNFNLPHQVIYNKKTVSQVILPGEDGEFGVTAGHSAQIEQLNPGVVTILHESVSRFYFL